MGIPKQILCETLPKYEMKLMDAWNWTNEEGNEVYDQTATFTLLHHFAKFTRRGKVNDNKYMYMYVEI